MKPINDLVFSDTICDHRFYFGPLGKYIQEHHWGVYHYLRCPILWYFAREALKIQENVIFIGSRLCLVACSIAKLKILAFTHCLYHSLKNTPSCVAQDGYPVNANSMQLAAGHVCRSLKFSFPESL